MNHNLESFELQREAPSERCAWHLQVDGVAASERFRPSPHDGLLRGAARESNWAECPSLEIKSYLDLELMKSAHDDGHLLLAKEIDVFAIGPNREANYGLTITAASGTAKKGETAGPLADAINLHIEIWNSDSRCYDARGPMTTVQSDGAAVMRRALHLALTKHTIDATSKVGVALGEGKLVLFNYLCGGAPSRPTVAGCDDNHVGKRLRMALKALRAATQIADFMFGRELLRGLLSEIGFTGVEIAEAMAEGSEDAQNVSAMIKFLRMMATFTRKQVADFPAERQSVPTFRQQFKALVILSEYCRNFVEVITGLDAFENTRLPLSALLRRASCLAHLAFVLYRRHGTKFIPSQHYGNTQAMIKAKFVSVASCQAEGINFYFSYFDATQRLEELFGMQRAMECGSSIGMVKFEERGGDLMESGHIYSERPELKSTSRRLGGHLSDHQNPRSALGSPKNYAPVDTRNVTISSAYLLGSKDCQTILTLSSHPENDPPLYSDDEVNFAAIAATPGVDMMRPRGEWVGVDGTPDPTDESTGSSGGATCEGDIEGQTGGGDLPPCMSGSEKRTMSCF